ncbi:response regulator containing a CheY-like receiver domain and an HTH DNA-binding domain [Aequorivita sublithincola DSM 14238]|uniref:Response regulator containing a CheY-like receiver domain and an HTH DNA-binding domain n=1 Tax=Aequorivita sublithincola (strain DSM 14238 / LMG 21431 / ACAM 643 / 9-3) TaxID=746697 RepID=I3YZV1_AEQSU|nr:response regulator [Aequorivita sublithincola]AFL82519.1 response regulator containing a CheY-like receiver domain and an HTH DNA-binding domain [Aequorivita sublithincola DSM 14238]
METKTIHTLIIDDHPLIIEAYRSAMAEIQEKRHELVFVIEEATSCDSATFLIERSLASNKLDLVFLDIKLPPAVNGPHLSGEDLGLEIRQKAPKTKIVVATTFNDNYRIQSIFKNINPEGFLIKSDISSDTLVSALVEILVDPPYYSKTVLQSVRKYISHDFLLDKWDRFLLYELSRGTKMKELPTIMPFSLGALEKRKRHLRTIFDVTDGEDRALLTRARKLGFI